MSWIERATGILAEGKDRYDRAAQAQMDLFLGKDTARQPLLLHASLTEAQNALPSYTSKEIHFDHEKMMIDGLKGAMRAMNGRAEAAPSLRANMGCGIVPALFGVLPMLFDDKMPWVKQHLSKDQLREMTVKDIRITPEFKMAMEHMDFFAEHLNGCGVRIFPVDIQGAFDTAHILLGDDIFYEIYDDPDFVHHLLDLCCAAIDLAFRECLKRMPGSDTVIAHYNALAMPRALGGIKLSEDTSTLLKKEHIDEFVAPYIHRALEAAGGGYVHYCGKNEHLYQVVLDEPLAYGLNFGNPDKHDMEQVLRDCAARGKVFYGGMPMKRAEDLRGFFLRMLRAATVDGRTYLLMEHFTDVQRVDEVKDAWAWACGAYERV